MLERISRPLTPEQPVSTLECLEALSLLKTCADLDRITLGVPGLKYIKPEDMSLPKYMGDLKIGEGEFLLWVAIGEDTTRETDVIQVKGADVGLLPANYPVVAYITTDDLKKIPSELSFLEKNLSYYQNLAQVFEHLSEEKEFSRDRKRNSLATLIESCFRDLSKIETDRLIKTWIISLNSEAGYYHCRKSGRSNNKSGEIIVGTILRELSTEDVIASNPFLGKWKDILSKKAQSQNFTHIRTMDVGKAALMLAIVADERMTPQTWNAISSSKELEDTTSYILSFSENLIARAVLSAPAIVSRRFVQLSPRIEPILRLFVRGKSQAEVIESLGLRDYTSNRKNISRMMSQFSFGRAPGKQKNLRYHWVEKNGVPILLDEIQQLADEIEDHYVPYVKNDSRKKRAAKRYALCKSFAKKWNSSDLSTHDQELIGAIIAQGKNLKQIAKIVGLSVAIVRTFVSTLDKRILDHKSVAQIFPEKIPSKEKIRDDAYHRILIMYQNWRLNLVLPDDGNKVIDFIKIYFSLKKEGFSGRKLADKIAETLSYEYSYVSVLHQKAATLHDLLLIVDHEIHNGSNNVLKAWALQKLVNDINQNRLPFKLG